MKKGFLTNFKKFLFIVISLSIISFIWWLILIFNTFPKKFYIKENYYKYSETLIVVLTGGKGRIEKGLELFEKNFGEYLFISGVFEKSELEIKHIVDNKLIDKDCCVIVDNKAKNTFENAYEVKKWLDKKIKIKNIILVSSYYHLPRSYIVFKKMIKTKNIVLSPVNKKISLNENYGFYIRLITLEFFKTIYTLFFEE